MNTKKRRNKSRSIRKPIKRTKNKKKLGSLEALEPRKLLSGNTLDFTITLQNAAGQTVYDTGSSSYSYQAPWLLNAEGYPTQGSGESQAWTAVQGGHTNTINHNADGIIKTIGDFYDALVNHQVAEVSDDLVGCFYFTPLDTNGKPTGDPSSLYSPQIEEAWVSSSDNLYSLLVLNQRFPASAGNSNGVELELGRRGGNGGLYGGTQESNTHGQLGGSGQDFSISDKALQGMARIVGFASGGIPELVSAPSKYLPQLAVFNRSHGPFEPADPHQGGSFSSLSDYVPTLRTFFKLTNQNRPSNIPPLPLDVLEYLENKYSEGFSQNKNPIEIFSELSGISSLGALLAAGQYPQVADPAPPSFPITQYGNPPVYDAYFNPPALEYRIANYDTYQQACEDVGGYYLQSGISNEIAIQNFFSQFAHGKLTELAQIDPISNSAAHESKIAELAVGLRALMALSYDAAPLWTSYGVGYSNAANPMVGNTDNSQPLIPQLSTQTFLEGFSGQEFQLQNIQLPTKFINIRGESAPGGENYPTYGWYQLDAVQNLPAGNNPLTPPSTNYFRSQYSISHAGTAAHMPSDSTSSDTLSAAGLATAQENEMLTRASAITVDGVTKTFGELDGLIHDEVVLANPFATYISLGGGIDVVTGSSLNDVIVGPGHGKQFDPEFHGRLTVDSGPGNDIVAPGRGGSVVKLGTGADLVVFGTNDLFGEATFFDFNFAEGDRIIISDDISREWHASTPDTLILNGPNGESKTLRLAAASDNVWHDNVVMRIQPTSSSSELTAGLSPNGEFNYLETHQFVLPPVAAPADVINVGNLSLKIEKSATGPDLPEEMWITAANVQHKSTRLSDGTHVVKLGGQGGAFQSVFNSIGLDKAYQISITPYDDATVRGFGNRQAEVFITRDNGYVQPESSFPLVNGRHNTLETSKFGTPGYPTPKTGWRMLKVGTGDNYSVAYVGGLANYFLDSGMNATGTAPTTDKSLQITVDSDFMLEAGTGQASLSGRMAVWGSLSQATAEAIMSEVNTAPVGSYDTELPSLIQALAPEKFLGIRSLATDQRVIVNGTGRLNGYNIVQHSGYTTTNQALLDNPIYMVNSDMLTVSSVHHTVNSSETDWAVDVSGVTVAWPGYRGYGSVLLQDFNSCAIVELTGGTLNGQPEYGIDLATSADNRFHFQNSKVKIYDYKQAGGWVDRADGPGISAWHSQMTNSFIHTSDDSIKVQAMYINMQNNTVLQGDAGNAVGCAYGFVNKGVYESTVSDVYAHRIVNKNGYGVVAMRVIPAAPYWNWGGPVGFGILDISNVFVPAFDKTNFGSMNSVSQASVLSVGNEARGFGPTINEGDPPFTFMVGGINTQEGWQINANHALLPQASVFEWDPAGTPNPPVVDGNGHWTFQPTTFPLYETLSNGQRQLTSTEAKVEQLTAWGPIALYQIPTSGTETETIKRPKLHRSSKISLNRNGQIGPSPVRLVHSDLVGAAAYGSFASEQAFVISAIASGHVEKKIDEAWVNISKETAPQSSNPLELLKFFRRRLITSSDEIRWVPGTDNASKQSVDAAFAMIGWHQEQSLKSKETTQIHFEIA